MENKEKNNNQGLFLVILGVATLVIAIAGATFAFFSATVSGNTPVNATSYSFAVTLAVTKEMPSTTPSKGEKLIPLVETDMGTAVGADCTDTNGYAACKVYKLRFNNTSGQAVTLSGNLTASTNGFSNLYYKVTALDAAVTTLTGTGTKITGSTPVTTGFTSLTIGTGTHDMYLILYIKNLDSNQTGDQNQSFVGTLTFNDTTSGSNGQLKATFS